MAVLSQSKTKINAKDKEEEKSKEIISKDPRELDELTDDQIAREYKMRTKSIKVRGHFKHDWVKLNDLNAENFSLKDCTIACILTKMSRD